MIKGYTVKRNKDNDFIGFDGPGEPGDRKKLSCSARKTKRAKNKVQRQNKKKNKT